MNPLFKMLNGDFYLNQGCTQICFILFSQSENQYFPFKLNGIDQYLCQIFLKLKTKQQKNEVQMPIFKKENDFF